MWLRLSPEPSTPKQMSQQSFLVSFWASSLEVEVKSDKYAATPNTIDRQKRRSSRTITTQRDDSDGLAYGILVMPRHAAAAKHNWVVPVTNGIRCHIAKLARYGSFINQCLLCYTYLLEAAEEKK